MRLGIRRSQAVDLEVVAPGGEGDHFLLHELIEELLGGAHLQVVVDREPGGGDGLHLSQLLHELLGGHLGDVQGADGLLELAFLLGFLFLLPPLLPLDLLHTFLCGHGVSHSVSVSH